MQALATAAGADGFPLAVAVTGAAPLAELDVGLPRGPVKVVLDDARLPRSTTSSPTSGGPVAPAAASPCTA